MVPSIAKKRGLYMYGPGTEDKEWPTRSLGGRGFTNMVSTKSLAFSPPSLQGAKVTLLEWIEAKPNHGVTLVKSAVITA